jgi:hypothetical protein
MARGKISGNVALAIAIIGGLIIGKLIRKFSMGLLLGVMLSFVYVLMAGARRKGDD